MISPARTIRTLLVLSVALLAALPAAALAHEGWNPDDPTDRVEGNNPSITQKVLGYDASVRAAGHRPDVLVLGSSRGTMIDPQLITRLTGASAYNASISSGAARELLATGAYADLRSAGDLPHLVVLLDLEAFDNRRPTTRIVDYLHRLDAVHTACPDPADCPHAAMVAARRLALDAIARQPQATRPYQRTQRADGLQVNGALDKVAAAGGDLGRIRSTRIAQRVHSYRKGGFDKVYPAPLAAFEQLLALANARGDTPFIAITGMHPDCIRICGPAGWTARRREVRALLDDLHDDYDFRLLDLSFPSTWGGSGASFFDEVHLRTSGATLVTRRLARAGAFDR